MQVFLHLDEIVTVFLTAEGKKYLQELTKWKPEKLLLLAGRTADSELRVTLRELIGLFGDGLFPIDKPLFEGNFVRVK